MYGHVLAGFVRVLDVLPRLGHGSERGRPRLFWYPPRYR